MSTVQHKETSRSKAFIPPLVSAEYTEVVYTPSPSLVHLLLGRLLSMADAYRRNGAPRQAIEMYFELAERNAFSHEGRQARDRLVAIADEYDLQGMPHQARSIYENLLIVD